MKFRLKEQIKESILTDPLLLANVAVDTGRSIDTIRRWIREDHEMLLMLSVLNSIKKHMSLDDSTILTEEVNEEAQA